MAEPAQPYTLEELQGDGVSKKDLVTFLQANASITFLSGHKLKGQLKSIAKTKSKDQLIAAYKELFETKAFKKEGEEEEVQEVKKVTEKVAKVKVTETKEVEEPKYTKHMTKKGDNLNFPKKGDMVSCFYTGKLEDGTTFDSNTTAPKRGKKPQPLKFKVGTGKVIKGWDHALQTMSVGEKADVVIQPEWAYGKKGLEGKIPPNATLHFSIELVSIE